MLDKLFLAMAEQAVKAANASPVVIDVTKDTFVRQGDGTFTILQGEPAKRSHKATDLETVVSFALRDPAKSAIWYSPDAVVALLDDEDRRETVKQTLVGSPQWKWLIEQNANPKQLAQRDLIFTLRTMFRENLSLAGDLIGILRQINFKAATVGESTIQKGKSSVGKTITAEVQGVAEIPDYVTLQVPVWAGSVAFIRVNVNCFLEADEQSGNFKFAPLPGQMDVALSVALNSLAETLVSMCDTDGDADEVRIYRGEP